jgi:hypothetical protein
MAKTIEHPLYGKFSKQRERIRDVLEGSDQVKSKKESYLPRLTSQSDTEYAAYLLRATFFNITSRVYDSNVGMITRRSPTVELPTSMDVYLQDRIGFSSFTEVSNSIIKEILAIGNVGVFIDIKADRPIPVLFGSENITNWVLDEDGELARVVLEETKYDEDSMERKYKYVLQILDDVYQVETFIDGSSQGTLTPTLKGKTLEFIPFVGGNYKGISMNPLKSPILDIVDMNLSHFRSSADYEHGLHFVALPTPIFSGVTFEGKVKLGGSEGIVLPSDKAKAYYLEFQGQGLGSLAKSLIEKQSQISLFSARLQDTNTKGSEAESTVKLRYSADSASLYGIALSAELVLNEVYKIIALWLGETMESVTITLNKDFLSTKLSSAELKELATAYIDGAMDEETYLFNLERGEMTVPGKKPKLPPKPIINEQNPNPTQVDDDDQTQD